MTTNIQKITQLETKIVNIQNTLNKWEQELMHYKNILQAIIKQVKELKTNSKNIK